MLFARGKGGYRCSFAKDLLTQNLLGTKRVSYGILMYPGGRAPLPSLNHGAPPPICCKAVVSRYTVVPCVVSVHGSLFHSTNR